MTVAELETILVINPNSSVEVTDGIARALEPLEGDGPRADCIRLPEGPEGIETRAHVDQVIPLILREIKARAAAAYVIACFSDPGLAEARERVPRPVFGIAESAMLTALTLGGRFGIISILPESVDRHLRYAERLGLSARLAADLPIGLGVAELGQGAAVFDRLLAVGRELRARGADVLILGCAGMAGYRAELQRALDLPVVEPCQAAVAMAQSALKLGWHQAARPAG